MKVKFKKMLTVLGAVTLAAGLLSGCGKSGETTSDSTSGQKEIRISWWGGDSRNEAIQEAIKLFEEENPDIKVKAEFGGYPGYQEKMTTQLSGDTAADVIRLDSMWLSQYKNQLVDLKEFSEEVGLDNFSDDVLDPLMEDGKLVGLPLSTNYRALYYNKTVLDEFGIDAPQSWEDIIAMRDVLPEDYYPMTSPCSAKSTFPLFFVTLMTQQTGLPVVSDEGNLNYELKDFENMLNFYAELVEKRIMPSKKDVDNAGMVDGAPAPALMEGKWVSFFEWSANTNMINGQLAEQNFEMALAGFPSMEGEKSTGVYTKPSMVYSIPESCKNKKEAAMLIDFLMNNEEANKIQKLENGVPDSKTGNETLQAEGLITPLVADTIELGEQKLDTTLAGVYKWDVVKVSDTVHETITQLDYGKIDVSQAAQNFYDAFKAEEENMKK